MFGPVVRPVTSAAHKAVLKIIAYSLVNAPLSSPAVARSEAMRGSVNRENAEDNTCGCDIHGWKRDADIISGIRITLFYDFGKYCKVRAGFFEITRGIILMNVGMEGFPPCKRIPDAAKMPIVINDLQALVNDFLVRREDGFSKAWPCIGLPGISGWTLSIVFRASKEASSARHLSNICG